MDLCPADSTADMEEDKGDDEDELGNMAAFKANSESIFPLSEDKTVDWYVLL